MYLNYNIDKIYHYLMNLKSKFLFIIKDEGSINLNILKKIKSIKHNSIHVDVDKVNIQIKFHLFYTYIILYKTDNQIQKCCKRQIYDHRLNIKVHQYTYTKVKVQTSNSQFIYLKKNNLITKLF
jgi:hypothetical protein